MRKRDNRHLGLGLLPAVTLLLSLAITAGCNSPTTTLPVGMQQQSTGIKSKLYNQFEHWRGTPYRWGGESHSGVDCSALTQDTYKRQFGISLPRTTAQQVKLGSHVSKQALQAGDLVFFKTGKNTRHVGVYIENGKFLNASSSKGVILSKLNNPYWSKHYWQARRVL